MSNLIRFPKRDLSNPPSPTQDTAERVKLFDDKVTLYKRPELIKNYWHYAILTDKGYERKSTKTFDLAQATSIATARYEEIRWRLSRKLSISAPKFKVSAENWKADLARREELGGKHSTALRDLQLIDRYLIPYFGELSIADIRQDAIDDYHKNYLEHWHKVRLDGGSNAKKPSAVSMHNHEGLIYRIIDLAISQGAISQSERPVFKRTPTNVESRGGFEPFEVDKILARLEHVAPLPVNLRFRRSRKLLLEYVRFLLATGMRPGTEPGSVRFQDIHDNSHLSPPHVVIQVRDGKRGPRKVLVKADVMDIVKRIRELHSEPTDPDLLFTIERNKSGDRFIIAFYKTLKALGLTEDASGKHRSLYSCRHTYITEAIKRGVNLSFIAKNCGTSTHQIEKTYNHIIHTTMTGELLK